MKPTEQLDAWIQLLIKNQCVLEERVELIEHALIELAADISSKTKANPKDSFLTRVKKILNPPEDTAE